MGRKNRRGHGAGHLHGEFRTTLADRYRNKGQPDEELKPLRSVLPKNTVQKPRKKKHLNKMRNPKN